MLPVQTTDYIMDVVSSMERQGIAYSLCFRRVLWLQGLRLDNELLVSIIYHQVQPVIQVSKPLQLLRLPRMFFVPCLWQDEKTYFSCLSFDCLVSLQVLPDYMAGYLIGTHSRSFGDAQVTFQNSMSLYHLPCSELFLVFFISRYLN